MRGTLTETRPGVWRLRVYVGRNSKGHPIQRSKVFRGGKRAAQTALAQMVTETEILENRHGQGTVAVLLGRWLTHIGPHRRPSTIDRYRRKIDGAIVPALGHIRVERLRAEHLDRQYRAWLDGGLSPSTVHVYHSILSAALGQAVKWGWISQSPARLATPPAQARSQAGSVAPDHLRALLVAARDDDPLLAVAILLAAITGCRRGELCALRWSDMDMGRGVLRVSRSYGFIAGRHVEGPTKTAKSRAIAIDPVGLEALGERRQFQEWLAGRTGVPLVTDPYILSRDPRGGEPMKPDGLSHGFRRLCSRLGMPYHLHELRHFTATTLIGAGVDTRTVANRLGHADPSITLRVYSHLLEERDQHAADILGGQVAALPSG